MECGDVREKLDALSTGELDLPTREPIERHLEACGPCRQAYVRLRALAAFLRGAPAPPLPPGFASRAAARQAALGDSLNPFRWWTVAPIPMRAAAILVLAAGLSAGAFLGWNAGGRGESGAPRAEAMDTPYLDFLAHVPEASAVQAYLSLVGGVPKGDREP